ncbi:MAG: type II toxin-antitoxin system VapC family toxin [Candidatus Dormibacteria bacterium]
MKFSRRCVPTSAETAGVLYLDSSALVKLVVREPESTALRRLLTRRAAHATSVLARVEVLRAIRRSEPSRLPAARTALGKLAAVELTDEVQRIASQLNPAGLRTLDAIHLASALVFGAELDGLVTYDRRMMDAAASQGIEVLDPR